MRHLGNLDSLQQAKSLVSYLLVQGIESHLDQVDGQIEVWVKDEDRLSEASGLLEEFRQQPDDPKYSQSIPAAAKIIQAKKQRVKLTKQRIVKGNQSSYARKPHLTLALIGVCFVVAVGTDFGLERTPRDHPIYRALQFTCVGPPQSLELKREYIDQGDIDALALRTASLQRGELWRLITPIFIHYGLTHIGFNMIMLFNLASLLERRYSWKRLAMLVLCTAAVSNFVQCTMPYAWDGSPALFGGKGQYLLTQLGGMSGVVYGLFGYAWMKSVFDRQFGYRVPESTIAIMLVWLVACMFSGSLNDIGINFIPPRVANWAHGIGLLMGMVMGYIQSFEQPKHSNG